MKKHRRVLTILACLLITSLAIRRAFTVLVNLGTISHGSLFPRPHPGDVAMIKTFSTILPQHPFARLFVIRWHGQSGDYEHLVETQYDRPSRQLNIWSKGTSGWAPPGKWSLSGQYLNVTDSQFKTLAAKGGALSDLQKYGATRIQLRKRR